MNGIWYVLDQLGQALENSHAMVEQQRRELETLRALNGQLSAERDDLLHRADHAPGSDN